MSVTFNVFHLPANAEMYIYNAAGAMIAGPITDAENNNNNSWGSSPFEGDSFNIEIKVPVELKTEVKLNIGTIGYGYRKIFAGGFGTSAACEINVLCPLGNNWANERPGVAKVIGDQGTVFFSGALVMNTCGTNIPYFLTAWHALDSYVSTWQFIFQYWSPTCNPTQNTANTLQFNGATLESDNMTSDFVLVRLFQTPAPNSNVTYLGWNRAANAALNTVGIHHPEGDVMKICADANPPVLAGFNSPPWNTNVQNWWSAHFQQGTVEPGSSGSPLFDQNQRVVGQLTGNPNTQNNYCAEQIGEYGRFDLSWTGDGTNATRLSNWLDPTNTGALTTNATNISMLGNVSNMVITGSSLICASQPYSINTTLPVTWTVTPAGIVNFSCTNCTSTTATKVGSGNATITATVNAGCAAGFFASTNVSVGGPYVGINYSKYGSCSGSMQAWQLAANPTTGGTSYHWTVGNLGTGSSIYITNPYSNATFADVTGGGVVNLNYTDQCGVAQQNGVTLYSSCHGFAKISPNPASSTATVSTTSNKPQSSSVESLITTPWKIFKMNLLGQSGNILRTFNYPSGVTSTNIDLSSLPNGTYTLQLYDNTIWTSQQIVVLR